MTLALVRHGQTDWNVAQRMQGSSDVPLNARGRQQAFEAANRLSAGLDGRPWDLIVSSPLLRAQETAKIIAAVTGCKMGPVRPQLVERDYGDAEGTTEAEISFRWPDGNIPGLESNEAVVARSTAELERLAAQFKSENVLIVCHGTLIRLTLTSLTGHDPGDILNCSAATLSATAAGWAVHSINDQPIASDIGPTGRSTEGTLPAVPVS
jgi:probable phosphoglycerate mutase